MVWVGQALSYLSLLRALELFGGDRKGVHEVFCLRGHCFKGVDN